MALPPFFSPARPGPPPPQPPPPAPFGCPPPPLPSPAFLPPLPQRPGPYPGTSAPFLQPSLGLQPRVPAEASRRGGGGGSSGGFYSVPPPPLPPPPPQYRPFPGTDAGERPRPPPPGPGPPWSPRWAEVLPPADELGDAALMETVFGDPRRRGLPGAPGARSPGPILVGECARGFRGGSGPEETTTLNKKAKSFGPVELRAGELTGWRVKCVQEVEEKKREQELKAAADGVLSEVRKKQADTKRMVDILRALEKLRKLRKEAAARKGVCPPASADETFEYHLQRLRKLIKKRSELYEAEERALRVMLEGEQEEERKRELEKKQRKEKEKFLLQKREIESKLFGDPDEFPLAHLLQPFRQYYLQAEHSLPALIQIRHDWDQYLVPADHPKGSSVPQGWVLPTIPSNDIWASAVKLQ
uniref:Programmed cell death 7 n=1 Tax=Cavia porcellus TaxID=10141 RepID=H0VLY3_CAVPO